MSELEPTSTGLEPTATERLRTLLDERGVEWTDGGMFHRTHWVIDGIHYVAFEQGGKLYLQTSMGPLTPEQAIAATLGSCNCSSSERTSDVDATGERRGDVEMCHDKNGFDPDTGFECTVCGTMVDSYMVTPADTGHEVQFHYCPFCGRVVDDG